MKAKKARLYFLGLSLLLAVMMIFKLLSPLSGSLIFAGGLVFFGLLSGGFRKQ
jgi:hypothetical protein